jgi:HEAT repeat protein
MTLAAALAALAAAPIDAGRVKSLVFPEARLEEIRALGPAVLPVLASLYERSGESDRAGIASVFYALGWPSPDAKRVLLRDLHTPDENLRLQAQWAIGRVSADPDVMDALLDTMRNDGNPLFRDKAACALAHDQIHLSEPQKLRLFERLIDALGDPKEQVRDIALKALVIHTGQSKGFSPSGSDAERDAAIKEWRRWLERYRSAM